MREGVFVLCRGVGQVMFQNNALSGALMLAGIACNSWLLALLAVAGNLTGTLTAYFAGYPKEDIRNGLYGFNGTLTGIATGVFIAPGIGAIVFLILSSCLSTWIAAFFNRQNKVPGFTAPFILSVWLLLAGCRFFFPSLLLSSTAATAETTADFFRSLSLNFGQVMFQGNSLLTGLFFLAGIFVNSRLNALFALWGAALPLALALLPETDYVLFNTGMYGYNGVLCGIALSGRSSKDFIRATLAIVLSTGLQVAGIEAGVTTLTAPFVAGVWAVLYAGYVTRSEAYRRR